MTWLCVIALAFALYLYLGKELHQLAYALWLYIRMQDPAYRARTRLNREVGK